MTHEAADSSRRRRNSLQRTLLSWLLWPLFVLVPLAAALVYALSVQPALDSLDRALTDTAVALSQILTVNDGRPVLPLADQTAKALRADLVDEVMFAVGDDHARPLVGEASLLALAGPLAAGQWRLFDADVQGRGMRIAAYGARCGQPEASCPVVVAESLGKRKDAQKSVAAASLAAAALLALSLMALALLAVHRGLRPMRRAAAEVAQRSLDRLEPIPLDAVPPEADSFVVALNDLFARVRAAARAQRAFVEDASHQLRTPLATLLSESAQALEQPHPPALRPTLERLHSAAERGARLAQQLLTLARTDGTASRPLEPLDLAALLSDNAADWVRASLAARQDLGFDLQPAPVRGDPLLLRELAGNLVTNAIAHAGADAKVTVRCRREGSGCVLEVEDDGPGIAATERERVWDRFHRGAGARGLGTGLGLSIVRDIAGLHDGHCTLRAGSGGRGVVFVVTLPAAEQAVG